MQLKKDLKISKNGHRPLPYITRWQTFHLVIFRHVTCVKYDFAIAKFLLKFRLCLLAIFLIDIKNHNTLQRSRDKQF